MGETRRDWKLRPGHYPSAEGGNADWWLLHTGNPNAATGKNSVLMNCSRDLAERVQRALVADERGTS